jgi:hypothetical protein
LQSITRPAHMEPTVCWSELFVAEKQSRASRLSARSHTTRGRGLPGRRSGSHSGPGSRAG